MLLFEQGSGDGEGGEGRQNQLTAFSGFLEKNGGVYVLSAAVDV